MREHLLSGSETISFLRAPLIHAILPVQHSVEATHYTAHCQHSSRPANIGFTPYVGLSCEADVESSVLGYDSVKMSLNQRSLRQTFSFRLLDLECHRIADIFILTVVAWLLPI